MSTIKTSTPQILSTSAESNLARSAPIQLQQHPISSSSFGLRKKSWVEFVPRSSLFDSQNHLLNHDPFRGFYSLFWILLAFHILSTLYSSGSLCIQMNFAKLFLKHLNQLIIVDLCLIGSTFFALGFAKLLSKGFFKSSFFRQTIQHSFQSLWLGFWIYFIYTRQWPWVQSGFLTLHSLTMLMKMHSYCATNGEFFEQFQTLICKLNKFDQSFQQLNLQYEPFVATQLFQIQQNLYKILATKSQNHPNQHLPVIQEILELLDDLGVKDDKTKHWPQNLTFDNFVDYLLVPTLVYELKYPRTKKIRYAYVVEKVLATAGAFGLVYVIIQYYVWNQISSIGQNEPSLFGMILRLVVPFSMNYLLIFYIIFECICNGFAELTRFADREFYSDWWNSVSFDEFSRKWNKPVHNFLLKHVYASTITTYGLSRHRAGLVTLILSSLVHELLMAMVMRKLRWYLFLAQMTQVPLTIVGKSKFFIDRPKLGNAFFWIGLLSGFPFLGVCYILY
ncbi:hypothetical protein O181_054556 [Austropuccinia psidii MF-1]|uniref:O-acyltransferase n=1 Tax=Austropuccinia psidii MF-1 TaxID=1389203 RepID=A0A9Q3HR90_9BASI|nr:hypothetical protein [Austropuccinia psidii MF-1]